LRLHKEFEKDQEHVGNLALFLRKEERDFYVLLDQGSGLNDSIQEVIKNVIADQLRLRDSVAIYGFDETLVPLLELA